jgi:hypothetical protein
MNSHRRRGEGENAANRATKLSSRGQSMDSNAPQHELSWLAVSSRAFVHCHHRVRPSLSWSICARSCVAAAVSSRSRGPHLYARVCALPPPCRLRVPIRVVTRLWSCLRRRVVARVVGTRAFVRCRHRVVTRLWLSSSVRTGSCVAAAMSSAVRACSCVNKGSSCVFD